MSKFINEAKQFRDIDMDSMFYRNTLRYLKKIKRSDEKNNKISGEKMIEDIMKLMEKEPKYAKITDNGSRKNEIGKNTEFSKFKKAVAEYTKSTNKSKHTPDEYIDILNGYMKRSHKLVRTMDYGDNKTSAYHSLGERKNMSDTYAFSKEDFDRMKKNLPKEKHIWVEWLEMLSNKPYHSVHPHTSGRIGHIRYDMNFPWHGEKAIWVQEIQSDLEKNIKAWGDPADKKQPSGPWAGKGGRNFGITDMEEGVDSYDEDPPDKPYEPDEPDLKPLVNEEEIQLQLDRAIAGNANYKVIVKEFLDRYRTDSTARFTEPIGSYDPVDRRGVDNDYEVSARSFRIVHTPDGIETREGKAQVLNQLNSAIEQAGEQQKAAVVQQLEQQIAEYDNLDEIFKKMKDKASGINADIEAHNASEKAEYESKQEAYRIAKEEYDEKLAEYKRKREEYFSNKVTDRDKILAVSKGWKSWATNMISNWHIFALKKLLAHAKSKGCKYFILTGRDKTGFDEPSTPFQRDQRGNILYTPEGEVITTKQYEEYYPTLASKLGMKEGEIDPDNAPKSSLYHDTSLADETDDSNEDDYDTNDEDDNYDSDESDLEESLSESRFKPYTKKGTPEEKQINEVRFWWIPIDKAITRLSTLHESKLFAQNKEQIIKRLNELKNVLQ